MGCKVLHVDSRDVDSGAVSEAARVVDGGGLVCFPTETVYGIAARVREDSLCRLDEVKGRDPSKPYTVHIGRREDVGRYVPAIGAKAGKVIENAWPGPLTIVFELGAEDLEKQRNALGEDVFGRLYRGNAIGVRCPDNAVAAALLEAAEHPVVAPSANAGGDPPAVDGQEAFSRVGDQVDLLLDGGPCKYGKSSTVAVVNNRGVIILRGGIYSEEELKAYSQINVLFVCTGNTCRSPMAEGIFKKYLAEKLGCAVDELGDMGYKVASAGLLDMQGGAASSESVAACAARGVDIGSHKSQPVSPGLVCESDFIFAMERMHQARVVALSADAAGKCILLADENISDPIGQRQSVYNKCADAIEDAVKKRIGELIV
ncbi:MAG: L-threonylcarbamoyladenylate synthase [Planctomycetota bacterium]|jgi:protein-tyrosine phosphatase